MSAYPADPPLRSPLAGARCDAHSGGRLMTAYPADPLRSAPHSPGLAAMLTPEAGS
jgi:hypothetical protein